jgi:hypothetical protein
MNYAEPMEIHNILCLKVCSLGEGALPSLGELLQAALLAQ